MTAEPTRSVSYEHSTLHFGDTSFRVEHSANGIESSNLSPQKDPLAALDKALSEMPPLHPTPNAVPFTGGFIGLFGYALHQHLERHTKAPPDPTKLPEIIGGYYDWALVTDHYRRTTTLYSHRASAATERLRALFTERSNLKGTRVKKYTGALKPFTPTSSDAEYFAAFKTIQNYILAGDCYQTNLARHYQAKIKPAEGWPLYKRLQAIQGSAFSTFLNHPSGTVLSLSPERLALKMPTKGERSLVETCPIKGTAPRLASPLEDERRAQQLLSSRKNRAENLMIVDLLRNDLGRIAALGSVRVRTLFELVSLPNVHHLVSTITAEIPSSYSAMDLMRTLLPGGSITGAPKLRAIDIINDVEAVGRSAYCGSLGYIDHGGRMDMNIAIRTLVLDPSGDLHLWGGGAIVADSDAASEAREIDHKIGKLIDAL